MDIGKSFSFAFEDEEWLIKLLLGAIVLIIPIFGMIALLGYMIRVIRNVRDEDPEPLPAWNDFGEYLLDGFKVGIGIFVYFLPLFLLICSMVVIIIGIDATMGSGQEAESLIAATAVCFSCLIFIISLIPLVLIPALMGNYAEEGSFGSLFQFGRIFALMGQDIGRYAMVLLISFVAIYILAPFGLLLCFVGVFLTQWWSYLVLAHLTGQLLIKPDNTFQELVA